MAGPTLDRQLTSARAPRVAFAVATPADDPEIRRLLRENPTPGQIALAFEREPDYFADADFPETAKHTIVARENGRAVCVGNCTVRPRFVNGTASRVGYLGGLRLDARAAGRFDILRRGYEFFRELQAAQPADYYFTSIAADNLPARRFLERGLPGMPRYEFVSEFVTLLVPVKPQPQDQTVRQIEAVDFAEVLELLTTQSRAYQFAECWTAGQLAALARWGLGRERFACVRAAGSLGASAALWDQRAFKQTVLRGYAPWLALARPVVNGFARLLGPPPLPPVGTALAQAYVSHLAVAPTNPAALLPLLGKIGATAAGLGIELLTLGFGANDPRLALVRSRFRCRQYRSRIYLVRWPDRGASPGALDGRPLGLEVALL